MRHLVPAEEIQRVQQEARLDPEGAARRQREAQVGPHERRRVPAQSRAGSSCGMAFGAPAPSSPEPPGAAHPTAEAIRRAGSVGSRRGRPRTSCGPLRPLLGRQLRGGEEVEARQRTEERGQGRGVVGVAVLRQRLEELWGPAEPRPAESRRLLPGGLAERFMGAGDLLVEPLRRIALQPAFVPERVVADLVPPLGDRPEVRQVRLRAWRRTRRRRT